MQTQQRQDYLSRAINHNYNVTIFCHSESSRFDNRDISHDKAFYELDDAFEYYKNHEMAMVTSLNSHEILACK